MSTLNLMAVPMIDFSGMGFSLTDFEFWSAATEVKGRQAEARATGALAETLCGWPNRGIAQRRV